MFTDEDNEEVTDNIETLLFIRYKPYKIQA